MFEGEEILKEERVKCVRKREMWIQEMKRSSKIYRSDKGKKRSNLKRIHVMVRSEGRKM